MASDRISTLKEWTRKLLPIAVLLILAALAGATDLFSTRVHKLVSEDFAERFKDFIPWLSGLLITLLLFSILRIIYPPASKAARGLLDKTSLGTPMKTFMKNAVPMIYWGTGGFFVLSLFGQPILGKLALSATMIIAALAVALQGLAKNLVAGVIMQFDSASRLQHGDDIELLSVKGVQGTVVYIGYVSTIIETPTHTISISNSQLVENAFQVKRSTQPSKLILPLDVTAVDAANTNDNPERGGTMASMKTATLAANANPADVKADVVLIGVFESDVPVNSQAAIESFTGTTGSALKSFDSDVSAEHVIYFGLGKQGDASHTALAESLTAAFKRAKEMKAQRIALAPLPVGATAVDAETYGRLAAERAGMANYHINHFKTAAGGHKTETSISKLFIAGEDRAQSAALRRGMAVGTVIANAVNKARDLVNLPPSMCTPNYLAAQAEKLARSSNGAIKVKLVRRSKLEKLGANAFLAVAKGSSEEPVLIELTYSPADAKPGVVLGLVGKSVTFDSGGLDIKSADGMRTMKCDMAGGATVLSALGAIAALKLPVTVKVYMAATENMTGEDAYKPGDVLTSLAGLTIEVDNTDAEGRLTLADAITYAKKFGGVTHLVDLATLTGAMLQTTADVGAGIFTNNADWQAQVMSAADSVDELLWPMPMWPQFKKAIESSIADLKNSGGKFGAGASTAALFLQAFAGDTPWVHLDIAGTAFRHRAFGPDPAEATGWGTRTLIALAQRLAC